MGNRVITSSSSGNGQFNRSSPLSNLVVYARRFSCGQGPRLNSAMNSVHEAAQSHRAFIALGSNVGDRVEMIEKACLEMDRANIRVKRTSSLFETTPMYVLDQATFMNGVCEVSHLLYFITLDSSITGPSLIIPRLKPPFHPWSSWIPFNQSRLDWEERNS